MSMMMGCSTPASKRYQKRVLMWMVAYMAVLFAAAGIVRHGHPQGWHLYFWALLPALPIMGVIFQMGHYLQDEKDEYLRMQTMRSMLFGTGALIATIVVSDFLRSFTPVGVVPPFWQFVIFFVAFGLAQTVQQLRNRASDDESAA